MKVCVLGDGGWGTALAMVLDRNGHKVSVWGPFPEQVKSIAEAGENIQFLPGVRIPHSCIGRQYDGAVRMLNVL